MRRGNKEDLDSIHTFLASSKTSFQNLEKYENIHFVIGNEAADLDSVISAVIYSYYLWHKIEVAESAKETHIPIIWCHENDLALRTEVIALFKEFHIDAANLLFCNQLQTLKDLCPRGNVKVTLVDHNNAGEHLEFNDYVVEIVDHHEDVGRFPDVSKCIQPVGSCCTLIAQKIHYENNKLLDNHCVSELLLAAILIDTFNLDLHSGRTTEQDVFIAEVLSTHTHIDTEELFSSIQKAKMDITTMATYDILRKDYKPVQNESAPQIGISSATISAEILLLREDFPKACLKYMKGMGLNALVIMFLTFEEDSQAERKIAMISEDCQLKLEIHNHLKQEEDLKLLESNILMEEQLSQLASVYDHNVKWSRKKVMPALQKLSFAGSK